jgi:hypothetical protein
MLGANSAGQLGILTTANQASPVEVPGLERVLQLAAGGAHTCALTSTGQVYCWGANHHGQLGVGTLVPTGTPRVIPDRVFTAIYAGGDHTCGVIAGDLWCWGSNNRGEVGDNSLLDLPNPQGTYTDAFTWVSLGVRATCIVAGTVVRCAGQDDWGQLGRGAYPTELTPVRVF